MKAIVVEQPGGAEQLKLAEVPDPTPGPDDLLVRVHASALNRADTNQREGNYPPQHGASQILGLELSGEVVQMGANVSGFAVGDRVYGLSGGGGYGELATLDQQLAMPIPRRLGLSVRRRHPRGLLHRQHRDPHAGRAPAGTACADPRRRQRRWHRGDPDRETARRRGLDHRRHR